MANPGVPAEELSIAEVRKIFMGDRQYWKPHLRITVVIRGPVAWERDVVLKTVYQMSEAQFRRHWIGKVFRDEISITPRIVYSNEMATALVARIPGSITFVDASQVPKGLKILKVLKTNEHLQGGDGYSRR